MFRTKKTREARKHVQQAAWIILDGGFAARPCTVVDVSSTGAKIKIDDPSSAHTKLRLSYTRDGRQGRHCEVIWRRGTTMGLKFCRSR